MDPKTLVDALIKADDKRARSKQTAIGVSSLGDCKRKVWHMAQGHKGTNITSRLASIMGTAIHASIEQAMKSKDALIEKRVEIDGLPPATIDYFNIKTGEVVDWKTIKLSGVDYFVSRQKRWQVQTYGYLLAQSGFDVKTVTLVGIPRDGSEKDIIVHSEPYDETIALEALQWLADIRTLADAPLPERDPASFCSSYCPFFGELCQGKTKDLSGEPIVDDVATDAAKAYVEISAQIKTLEAKKDSAKAALEGQSGITIDGIKVTWSEMAGRATPDMDAIRELIGDDVPMKVGAPSIRLAVK